MSARNVVAGESRANRTGTPRMWTRAAWLYYLLLWLLLFAGETANKWRDATYPVGTIYPFHIVFTGLGLYACALMGYLDRVAARSFDSFQVLLTVPDSERELLRRRLASLPAGGAVAAGVSGMMVAGLLIVVSPESTRTLKLATSLPAQIFDGLVFLATWFAFGVLIYHTVHQLHLVSRVYSAGVNVDLFHLGPFHAFSGLTAQTAAGITVLNYAWFATDPGIATRPVSLIVTLLFVIIAMLVFALPLWSAHQLLVAEKGRLQGEATLRVEKAVQALHSHIDGDKLGDAPNLSGALTGLEIEQRMLAALPTWPWSTELLRTLASAVMLPVLLWLLERALEHLAL